jgi:hypothetical protein
MTRIRSALTANQKTALSNPTSARVMIVEMNKQSSTQQLEIENLRANLADMQNKYEKSQSKYIKSDTNFKILQSKGDIFIFLEIMKFISSVGITGYGFYLISQHNAWGWLACGAALIIYAFLLWIQKRTTIIKE